MNCFREHFTVWALWIFIAFTLLLSGCSTSAGGRQEGLIASTAGCRLWPDSIDFRNGLTIRAFGDTLLQVRVEGSCIREVHCSSGSGADCMTVATGVPVVDAFCALEQRLPVSAVWSDRTPHAIFLDPLAAHRWAGMLRDRLRNGYVVPSDNRGLTWPVVNGNSAWLLAAVEVANASGSRRWLDETVGAARRMLSEDMRTAFNRATSLFYGMPVSWGALQGLTPGWMLPADMFAIQSFAVNAAYCGAMKGIDDASRALLMRNEHLKGEITSIDADSLRHTLHREFWLPVQQRFGAMLYGFPLHPVCAAFSDNTAQAEAVLSGVVSESMANAIYTRNLPRHGESGWLFTPMPQLGVDGEADALDLALVASAAAHGKATVAYEHYFSSLIVRHGQSMLGGGISSDMAFRPLCGLIVRGVLGMRFAFDGVKFAPNVPRWFGDTTVVSGVRWRKATFNITLCGHGSDVERCTVDGVPAVPEFASDMEGEHDVVINLSAGDESRVIDNLAESTASAMVGRQLPVEPSVAWPTPLKAVIMPASGTVGNVGDGTGKHCVWLNGIETPELVGNAFEIPSSGTLVSVQIASVDAAGEAGLSARPHLAVPEGVTTVVELADVARAGTKVLSNRAVAARFVESDRSHNRNIRLNVVAPKDGIYMVDVHYLSGLGLVNARRGTALRYLMVNGVRTGVFVFPQLTSQARSRGAATTDDWQQIASFSNPLTVHLSAGDNYLELRYFQITPVYLDPTTNTFIADYLRLIPLQ